MARCYQKLFHALRDVETGAHAIAHRNSVAKISGDKKSRRIALDVVHDLLEPSITDLVLRNGPLEDKSLLESGRSIHSQQMAQVAQRQRDQVAFAAGGEFWLPQAAEVTGEKNVTIGGAIRKERRRKNCSENIALFERGDQRTESIQRMTHVLAAKTEHHARHRRVANLL